MPGLITKWALKDLPRPAEPGPRESGPPGGFVGVIETDNRPVRPVWRYPFAGGVLPREARQTLSASGLRLLGARHGLLEGSRLAGATFANWRTSSSARSCWDRRNRFWRTICPNR